MGCIDYCSDLLCLTTFSLVLSPIPALYVAIIILIWSTQLLSLADILQSYFHVNAVDTSGLNLQNNGLTMPTRVQLQRLTLE